MGNDDIVYIKRDVIPWICTIFIVFRIAKDSYIYPFSHCKHEVKQMEEEKGYKGWKNYQTWAVKLEIDNNAEEEYKWVGRAKKILKDKKESPAWILADEMEDNFEENIPELTVSLWNNLLADALGEVDWYQIAKNIINEVKEDE